MSTIVAVMLVGGGMCSVRLSCGHPLWIADQTRRPEPGSEVRCAQCARAEEHRSW